MAATEEQKEAWRTELMTLLGATNKKSQEAIDRIAILEKKLEEAIADAEETEEEREASDWWI